MSNVSRPARALDKIRVLDMSRVLAGPWATQLLADLGADVIKVERPGLGDDTRTWGPPWFTADDGRRESTYFVSTNRGKRSIAVDIADPRGARLVATMATEADVLVENFKVGDLKRYGLDYTTLFRSAMAATSSAPRGSAMSTAIERLPRLVLTK